MMADNSRNPIFTSREMAKVSARNHDYVVRCIDKAMGLVAAGSTASFRQPSYDREIDGDGNPFYIFADESVARMMSAEMGVDFCSRIDRMKSIYSGDDSEEQTAKPGTTSYLRAILDHTGMYNPEAHDNIHAEYDQECRQEEMEVLASVKAEDPSPFEKMTPKAGFVYILTNEFMPGIVKVGMTTRSPALRASEISSSTGVPAPFVVARYFEYSDAMAREGQFHRRHSGARLQGREFFKMSVEEAIESLLREGEKPLSAGGAI